MRIRSWREYRMHVLSYKPITPKEHNDMAHTFDWMMRYGNVGNNNSS